MLLACRHATVTRSRHTRRTLARLLAGAVLGPRQGDDVERNDLFVEVEQRSSGAPPLEFVNEVLVVELIDDVSALLKSFQSSSS